VGLRPPPAPRRRDINMRRWPRDHQQSRKVLVGRPAGNNPKPRTTIAVCHVSCALCVKLHCGRPPAQLSKLCEYDVVGSWLAASLRSEWRTFQNGCTTYKLLLRAISKRVSQDDNSTDGTRHIRGTHKIASASCTNVHIVSHAHIASDRQTSALHTCQRRYRKCPRHQENSTSHLVTHPTRLREG
jgi:hypothetical protein